MENNERPESIYLAKLYPSKDNKHLLGNLGVNGRIMISPNKEPDPKTGGKTYSMRLLVSEEKKDQPVAKPSIGGFGN